jgi:hypothetical protein
LHLSGYYDGITRVPVIKDGVDIAYAIIKQKQTAKIKRKTKDKNHPKKR